MSATSCFLTWMSFPTNREWKVKMHFFFLTTACLSTISPEFNAVSHPKDVARMVKCLA